MLESIPYDWIRHGIGMTATRASGFTAAFGHPDQSRIRCVASFTGHLTQRDDRLEGIEPSFAETLTKHHFSMDGFFTQIQKLLDIIYSKPKFRPELS